MTSTPQAPTPLDETREFLGYFVDARATQLDAVAAWIAHTHVLEAFPATPRLLLNSVDPECGKSETLRRVRDLSANGWSARGTKEAIRSKLDCPPGAKPTIIVDEVSDIFGKAGRNGTTHPLGSLLRVGYKVGETESFSSHRVAEDVDIYLAAALAGRGNAVPDDIRSRSVVVLLKAGRPRMDYLVREHDPQARMLRTALGRQFRREIRALGDFRARGIHPKLTGRRREIWEPLFAVASVAGGTWPARILAAFLDLAIDQGDTIVLTPKQATVRDALRAAQQIGGDRVAGADLIEVMRTFGEALYEPMPDRALAMYISAALDPVQPEQFRSDAHEGRQVRGYRVADLERIAAERLPREPAEEEPEEEPEDDTLTIFDVDDTTDTTGETGETSDDDDDFSHVDTTGMDSLI